MEHFGEKMELLKLSKFKLQLRTLITEVRELREKERSATEQLRLLIQKQKQTEEEYGRRLQESQAELASSNELRQKLEREVRYLQNDNSMLENKQKELKGTIQSLLQSRDTFVNAYEESTCEMKRSIQCRDRKLSVLSEKIKYHLLLFDSIEKEATSVKKVVDNVQRIALHFEVGSLGIILRKIQDTVRSMNEEDKGVISSMLERQGGCNMILTKEDNRIEDAVNNNAEKSQEKAYGTGVGGNTSFSCSPISQKYKSAGNDLQENNNFDSCVSEASEFYRL
ncbi:hypothetical protein GBA52_003016 [Prunus armeniaca]|nr:hypothetical protein GBA52_003016 [Prunus armeniaca]